MYTATADDYAAIRFMRSTFAFTVQKAGAFEYALPPAAHALPSDIQLSVLSAPARIAAPWLAAVERRIRASINPSNVEYVNDGTTLTNGVAARALQFFSETWDVLPGEPYIYASLNGDLVAEFRNDHGTMTTIIGPKDAVTYVSVDGELLDTRIETRVDNLQAARDNLHRMTNCINKGRHGVMESA